MRKHGTKEKKGGTELKTWTGVGWGLEGGVVWHLCEGVSLVRGVDEEKKGVREGVYSSRRSVAMSGPLTLGEHLRNISSNVQYIEM